MGTGQFGWEGRETRTTEPNVDSVCTLSTLNAFFPRSDFDYSAGVSKGRIGRAGAEIDVAPHVIGRTGNFHSVEEGGTRTFWSGTFD